MAEKAKVDCSLSTSVKNFCQRLRPHLQEMTDEGDHEPPLWRKCGRATQIQDKSNELFPVEKNLGSASHAALQPRSVTFFDEEGAFIDKWPS